MKIIFTKHALEMLTFRRIKKKDVVKTINYPDNSSSGKSGKDILYKDCGINNLKVVVSKEKDGIYVVTQHWVAKRKMKK